MRFIKHKLRAEELVIYYTFGRVPCFTTDLLDEIRVSARSLLENDFRWQGTRIRRVVIRSIFPRFFCLGGDLDYFLELIRTSDRRRLADYAHLCLDCVEHYRQISQEVVTVAFLEGDCLGGGLESALAGQYVFAKKPSIRVGFPEARFGLFPGMGGHAICAEILGSEEEAEKEISAARIYAAPEAQEVGFIDGVTSVVPDELPFRSKPLFDRAYLDEKTERWVEQALELSSRNLDRMENLVRLQKSMKLRCLAYCKPLLSYRYVFGM